jgi:hypothetical protein
MALHKLGLDGSSRSPQSSALAHECYLQNPKNFASSMKAQQELALFTKSCSRSSKEMSWVKDEFDVLNTYCQTGMEGASTKEKSWEKL